MRPAEPDRSASPGLFSYFSVGDIRTARGSTFAARRLYAKKSGTALVAAPNVRFGRLDRPADAAAIMHGINVRWRPSPDFVLIAVNWEKQTIIQGRIQFPIISEGALALAGPNKLMRWSETSKSWRKKKGRPTLGRKGDRRRASAAASRVSPQN